MSNVTGTIRKFTVTVEAAQNPKVYNVSVPLANTEVSQALSANTKKFLIRVRDSARMQLAYEATESSTNFVTVPSGCTYEESELNFTGTLYFQTNKASQLVEIVEWT